MTFVILLSIHNFVRWIILLVMLATLLRVYSGWLGKRAWQPMDRMLALVFSVGIDVQLLLGLVLILVKGFAAVESVIWMEHVPAMLLAVVFAHVGNAQAKKAETDVEKFRKAAIWFSLTMLLVLLAIPWTRPMFRLF